ncbi:MAG: RHS repeat protein, partial [Acidobacteria bacterium]|nr:RHS repeat protein [Acidobacteriota bacterium]
NDAGQEYGVIRCNPNIQLTADYVKKPLEHREVISYTSEKYSLVWNQGFKGIFPKRITEKYYEGGSLKWVKTIRRAKYDGRGHFRLTQVYPYDNEKLPINTTSSYKESASEYDIRMPVLENLPTDLAIFDLSLLKVSYNGGKEYRNNSFYGSYKVAVINYNASGLLNEARTFYNPEGSISYLTNTDNEDGTDNPQDKLFIPSASSKIVSIYSYSNGNPTQVSYSNSDGMGGEFTQNLIWSGGVLISLRWGYGYNEFSRVIDSMGRITSESDPNGITTNYYYDALGRITKIAPQGQEVPTLIEYPLRSKTVDGVSWTIGNVIKFYRGNGPIPGDAPSSGTVILNGDGDIYTYYEFDDLGRLI